MGEILRTIKRRWPFAVLALLLSVAAAVGGFFAVGPTYRYNSAVLLLPPSISTTSDDFTKGNPLFYLGSLTQARDILVSELNSKNVQDLVEERFPGNTYSAAKDVLGSSPVVVLSVEGPAEVQARQLSQYLTDLVPERLVSLQDRLSIRQGARIGSEPLTVDQKPELRNRSQLRAAIVAGGGSLAVTVAVIMLVDSLLETRKTRAASPAGDARGTSRRRRRPSETDGDAAPAWGGDDDHSANRWSSSRDSADGRESGPKATDSRPQDRSEQRPASIGGELSNAPRD